MAKKARRSAKGSARGRRALGKKGGAVRRPAAKARAKAKAKTKAAGGRRAPAPPPSLSGKGMSEVAAIVCSALEAGGHGAALTGGACAAYYSGANPPECIELAVSDFSVDDIEGIMARLGFRPNGHRSFSSGSCRYSIALTPMPVSIGDDPVGSFASVRTAAGALKLLTPTDCVRQRLSMYYRWGDRKGLEEAVRVARRQRSKVDMESVRRWSEWEWASDKFSEFERMLSARA